jgi:hypothetical protein
MIARNHIFYSLIRWTVLSVALAGTLFFAAGTTHIPMLRAYLVGFSVILFVSMLAVDPGLAHERTHPQAGGQDGLLTPTFPFVNSQEVPGVG